MKTSEPWFTRRVDGQYHPGVFFLHVNMSTLPDTLGPFKLPSNEGHSFAGLNHSTTISLGIRSPGNGLGRFHIKSNPGHLFVTSINKSCRWPGNG